MAIFTQHHKIEMVKRECLARGLRIIPRGEALQILGPGVDLWVRDLTLVVLPRDLLPAR